ncbi:hypothetical protein FF80_01907 [Devosia sp. LC5]|uniref:hypothetical protein n=1 Tax=Devosia sp. LC5 TaxID=1502724 RepID=UPI0004E327C1|nr:hypothetical protein [Devosia sp. LC5]KFC68183.1 hypothetical protein FF80_01907 [Devosia sp. LC5]
MITRTKPDEQKPLTLSQMLEAATGAEAGDASILTHDDDIARTSLRIPRAVLQEVSALAQANRVSTSLLINLLLDNYLAGEGRLGYATLAPWYAEYVLRKKPTAD